MTRDRVLRRLHGDRCPFRVAMIDAADPELGPFLAVHAFHVPSGICVAVSRRLNHLLWGVAGDSIVVASVFDVGESGRRESELPDDVTWYEPGEGVVTVAEYAATGLEVRERRPPDDTGARP